MIDLTPLDVRKKHEDFKRIIRGFDPQEVQTFLEMVAERMEELVRVNIQLSERSEALQGQVNAQSVREQAVQDALVTAQELRSDMQHQSKREADVVLAEAQTEARRMRNEAEAEVRSMLRDAERKLSQATAALQEMERRRVRFLKAFRQLLERELDVVGVEEEREPLEDRPIELSLGGSRTEETAAPDEAFAEPDTGSESEGRTGEDRDDRDDGHGASPGQPPSSPSLDALTKAYGLHPLPGDGADSEGEGVGAAQPEKADDGTLFLSLEAPDPEDESRSE
jgi:DivIVA domain-containing protein